MIQPDSAPDERSQQVRLGLHALVKSFNENRLEQTEICVPIENQPLRRRLEPAGR